MTEFTAFIGLLATLELVAILALGVYGYRLRQQIQHLGAVCQRLTAAWKATTGEAIRVDPELLGGRPEEVTDVDDVLSKLPGVSPWSVTEDEEESSR